MNTQAHLTDEQLDLLLTANAPGPDEQAHLDVCPKCRQQVDALRATFADLRQSVTDYAAATRNPAPFSIRHAVIADAPPVKTNWRPRLAFAGSFAALALAVGASSLLPHRNLPPMGQPVSASSISPAAKPKQLPLESDEALLDGIDQDLKDAVPPSLKPLSVTSGSPSTVTLGKPGL